MDFGEKWKYVVFSDEKKFNLDGPDGFSYYWHDLRKNNAPRLSRNFGGGSLMTWAAFCINGKTPICFISTKMKSINYTDLLEDVLIDFLENNLEDQVIFQQDNAPIHKSRETMAWFESKNIEVMRWPAYSPDLNPIENLWGILSRKVYENGRQFSSIQELRGEVNRCWQEIQPMTLQSLINSMPNRIFEVIKNHGGPTKY